MAFNNNFTFTKSDTCNSFVFTDLSTYESPNNEFGDITNTQLSVSNITTGVVFDTLEDEVQSLITPGVPFVMEFTRFTISGQPLTYTVVPDGVWEITYEISFGEDIYSKTIKTIMLCESACKLKKLAAKVNLDCGCCGENSTSMNSFLEGFALYKAILFSGACGNLTEVDKNIKNLQDFLMQIDCSNCN